jgi:hypothetical protein
VLALRVLALRVLAPPVLGRVLQHLRLPRLSR